MSHLEFSQVTEWPVDSDLESMVQEQLAVNARLAEVKMPAPGSVDLQVMRKFRLYNRDGSLKPPQAPQGQVVTRDGVEGQYQVKSFSIDNPKGLYLHLHGGGWAMGSIYEQDEVLWDFAKKTHCTVISIDYPLAPEHQLHQILDFCQSTVSELIEEHKQLPIILGGESAGAHLALSTALKLKSEPNLISKVKALNLCYGLYDLSMTPSQKAWPQGRLGLSTEYLQWFYQLALPTYDVEARKGSNVSPLYVQDLRHMPAALFTIGEFDPVLDDSLFMASRWRAAGNGTELAVYPRAPHGFNGMPSKLAAAANSRIHQFVSKRL